MVGFAAVRMSAVAVALVLISSAASAAGAPRSRKAAAPLPPLVLAAVHPHAAQPRFFTINQVLAARGWPVDAAASPSRAAAAGEPFGLLAFRAPEGLLWVKWRAVRGTIDEEAKILERCSGGEGCPAAARALLALAAEAGRHEGRARIETANRLVNAAIRYRSDAGQHGVRDLWTAPLETLAGGAGDCEDYAIAKYVLLRLTGATEDDLRLLLVRDRGLDHAVLAVRHAGRWLMLDNRHALLQEAAELAHVTPLFALDARGVQLFAAPYAVAVAARRALPAPSPAAAGEPLPAP
jgi:predicted transglutaminase-like cysteine proteinase